MSLCLHSIYLGAYIAQGMSLICHNCDPGSIPSVGMCHKSGLPLKVVSLLHFSRFLYHVGPQNSNIRASKDES